MQTDQKLTEPAPSKKSKGRPLGFSPKTEAKGIRIEVQGDDVIIRVPKRDLSRKLLAELI